MGTTKAEIIAWDRPGPPTEAEILEIMRAEDLEPYRWSNSPGDRYQAHVHGYHKVIYVIQGSIEFELPADLMTVQLQVGDRLELPAGIRHAACVGPEGVICLEGHRR